MSHIAKIHFASVDKSAGCTCDRCGQSIQNIWTVDYTEGFSVHYGIDCWEKVYKAGKLSKYGENELRKAMKRIQGIEESIEEWKNKTEETYEFKEQQKDKTAPWYGHTFEEYRTYMANEFFPYRLEEAQKELEKFSKVDFKEVSV